MAVLLAEEPALRLFSNRVSNMPHDWLRLLVLKGVLCYGFCRRGTPVAPADTMPRGEVVDSRTAALMGWSPRFLRWHVGRNYYWYTHGFGSIESAARRRFDPGLCPLFWRVRGAKRRFRKRVAHGQ